jgi:hypothetical protein
MSVPAWFAPPCADNRDMAIGAEARLAKQQAVDGGFGPAAGAASEAAPTALAAIALDDATARSWLETHERSDGSFGESIGSVVRDDTPLVALALADGEARERALDHVEALHAETAPSTPQLPHRQDVAGWPWTDGTFGWTEPTAWGVLALRRLRPRSEARIGDGVALLIDRECVGGGWNYGNRIAFGVELGPYVQTTALSLLSLRGLEPDATTRGLLKLADRWRAEASGRLSLATAAAALRAYGHVDAPEALSLLGRMDDEAIDTTTLAWTTIALGAGLDRLVAS